MSWYQRGKEGLQRADAEAARQKERAGRAGIFEFFQPKGSTTAAVLLDPGTEDSPYPPFFFGRHSVFENGRTTRATCLGIEEGCPLCINGKDPKTALAVTAIVKEPYNDRWHDEDQICRDKDGVEWVFTKKVIVLQWKALENVKRTYLNRGKDLRFWRVLISRGLSGQECSTGETFDFDKKMDPSVFQKMKLKGDPSTWTEPVDYVKYFTPMPADELCRKFGLEVPVGSVSDPRTSQTTNPQPSDEDEDPFGGSADEPSGVSVPSDDDGDIF